MIADCSCVQTIAKRFEDVENSGDAKDGESDRDAGHERGADDEDGGDASLQSERRIGLESDLRRLLLLLLTEVEEDGVDSRAEAIELGCGLGEGGVGVWVWVWTRSAREGTFGGRRWRGKRFGESGRRSGRTIWRAAEFEQHVL